ncbi:murein L,D-transpeptidase [Streptomyces roseirectus]|uniref:Murein L,D-transpeptidase n=2 Tax=Streptomyces roseirectus TaxID=2768066 RepID=A0A7H0IS06_9ACTN|nr:murein L,D-transpeptidase [Streptomyces roseirectus]
MWRGVASVAVLVGAVLPGTVASAEGMASCTAGTGPYQRQLEGYLKRPVDGTQSSADCAAISAFQAASGLFPASGYADYRTYRMMLVARAVKNPNAARRCPVSSYRVACVDLARQLMWVQKGKRVLYKPVPIRSGRDGYETRTGTHRVYLRHKDHYSSLYNRSPMPYSQFFDGGQAFHGSHGDLFRGGSHGCVNLRVPDARKLWGVLKKGDRVVVWGVRPGVVREAGPGA